MNFNPFHHATLVPANHIPPAPHQVIPAEAIRPAEIVQPAAVVTPAAAPVPTQEGPHMASAFSTIIVDIEKFFAKTGTDLEKFGTAFQHLFGKAPQALQAVDNFIGELAPVVEGAVALADPVLEGPVADALSIVETGLAALQAAASAANSGTSFLGNLQAFARQVPALLTGIEVKNPALQAKVTGIVNLVTNEAKVLIPAVQSWVAQLAAKTPAAPAA